MCHPLLRPNRILPILIGLALLMPAAGGADDDWAGPARTTAGDLEDHEASSIDPDTREAESGEMQEGDSEDPDDLEVESEEMHVVEAGELEDHEGSSANLEDLPYEAPDDGSEVIDDHRTEEVGVLNLDAEQLVAKRRLERAEAEAEAARTRYGDMMRDDYPRGDARMRITEHRDESMRALKAARAAFDEAMGN
jgi:hypothetical protein